MCQCVASCAHIDIELLAYAANSKIFWVSPGPLQYNMCIHIVYQDSPVLPTWTTALLLLKKWKFHWPILCSNSCCMCSPSPSTCDMICNVGCSANVSYMITVCIPQHISCDLQLVDQRAHYPLNRSTIMKLICDSDVTAKQYVFYSTVATGCSGHVPLYTFPFMVIKRKHLCSVMDTVVYMCILMFLW